MKQLKIFIGKNIFFYYKVHIHRIHLKHRPIECYVKLYVLMCSDGMDQPISEETVNAATIYAIAGFKHRVALLDNPLYLVTQELSFLT